MKISVTRSGGIAGIQRTWVVVVDEHGSSDSADWHALIAELPWERMRRQAAVADAFTYEIRVSRRRIVVPEQHLTGPWKQLVDRVREAGGPSGR